jgi:hypothetical protein
MNQIHINKKRKLSKPEKIICYQTTHMTKAELNNPEFSSIIAEPIWDTMKFNIFREDYDVPNMKISLIFASYLR